MNTITGADFPDRREAFLGALTARLQADPRIRAAWLEGSLGRGDADRYSDLDVHLLLPDQALQTFRSELEPWLESLRPLALFNLLFGGQMVNALTSDGLRIDLWPHAGETFQIDEARALVLHETPGGLMRVAAPLPDRAVTGRHLLGLIREFWRCVTLLPAVLGRGERLVALSGLHVEFNLVSELLVASSGRVRDRGVKNLGAYLSPSLRRQLEALMLPADLSLQALADAHFGLVALVHTVGPRLAEQYAFGYPAALEETALNYVLEELALLGLSVVRPQTLPGA